MTNANEHSHTDPRNYMVPAALCGRHREVTRRWRTITRKAVKEGSWNAVLADIEWIQLEDVLGLLVFERGYHSVESADLLLYVVNGELSNESYKCYEPDREKWYAAFRDLLLEGTREFWYCLAALSGQSWLPECNTYAREKRRVSWRIMTRVMRHWDMLCQLDHRLMPEYPPWMMDWRVSFASWGRDMGIVEEEVLAMPEDMASGEHTIRKWIRQTERELGLSPDSPQE